MPASALVLAGKSILLRPPAYRDFARWAEARRQSREFLRKWEPEWANDELSRRAWRSRIAHVKRERKRGTGYAFLLFDSQGAELRGGITLSNIRRGVSQSAQIGYWMHVDHAGKGYMAEALGLIIAFAFERLLLHRIEAACIPGNERSIGLLEKAGFQREGLLKSYLRINGEWQDHYLYANVHDTGSKGPGG